MYDDARSGTDDSQQPLVGREREQAALREALTSALAGRGSLVLVGGEAGIGKTTLAEATLAEGAAGGAQVLVGHCYDHGETSPYGPWREALTAAEPGATESFLGSLSGGNETTVASQGALQQRARDALATLAAHRALVLLLEDLHWADPASLDLLRFLARGLTGLPLLILGTYRADELARGNPLYGVLPALVREARAARLDLHPLDEDDLRALVRRYALPPDDEGRLVAYLQARSEGNPFYAGELLRALEEGRSLLSGASGWQLGDLADSRVPSLLRQVIDGRLDRLGDQTRALLAVAAIIGHEAPLDLWGAVAGVGEEALLGPTEQATEARILLESADGMAARFAHALIREALYQGTGALRRRALHRRVAEALAAGPAPDPDAVAHHFQQAGDARAVEWLIAAGERAQRTYAWQSAAVRHEAALALLCTTGDVQQRILLLRRLAQALFLSAPHRGVEALEEAARLADSIDDRPRAAAILCELGMVRGGVGEHRRCLEELATGVEALATLPAEERRRLVLEAHASEAVDADYYRGLLVLRLGVTGNFAEALARGEHLAAEWHTAGGEASTITKGHVYSGLAAAYAAFGRPEAARITSRAAYDAYLAAGHGMQALNAARRDLLWVVLPYAADDPIARANLATTLHQAHARVAAQNVALPGEGDAPELLFLAGRWDEAHDVAREQYATAFEGERRLAAYVLGALARAQGNGELTLRQVRERLPSAPDITTDEIYWFLSDLGLLRNAALVALDAGDRETALAWLEAHDRWLAWSGAVLGRAEGVLGWAEYHRASGDHAQARIHAEQALAHATEPRQPLALLAAHRLLGELDMVDGHHADATAHLDAALALAEACAAPYERALTLLALAQLRVATDDREAAHAALTEGRGILEMLGARPAVARADTLVARLASPTPATPADVLPFGLTAREVDVLKLLAEGLTDLQIGARLFVSRNTVATHTRAIYGKLGVTTRAAAARLAAEHGLA